MTPSASAPQTTKFSLDIPRCHQYHPFMPVQGGAPVHAACAARVGAAAPARGVLARARLVAGAFASLYPTDEAMAFAALTFMTTHYQGDFTGQTRRFRCSSISLCTSRSLRLSTPDLAAHFAAQDFFPELYAVPWFLTLFAHVLPLRKVTLLWASLLVSPPTLALCFAVAIMSSCAPHYFTWSLTR